jgi:undecaprenyl-diphosphatase
MEKDKTIRRKIKGISLRVFVILIIFLIALAIFAFIANEVVIEKENNFDNYVFGKMSSLTSPGMTKVALFFTFFGSQTFLIPAYLLVILFFLFLKKNRRLSWNVTAIGITSTIVMFSVKWLFKRDRPLDPLLHNVPGFSFPSGHTSSSFTFFGLLIYIIWKSTISKTMKWCFTVFFILFACCIGLSRIYLHVHFPTDVVAGLCLSIIWLILSFYVLSEINRRRDGQADAIE